LVAAVRQAAEHQRAALDLYLPDWPVYAVADPPTPGWLATWSRQDDELVEVEFAYGLPDDTTWLRILTQPDAGADIRSLDWVLAAGLARDGREYPVPGALPPGTSDGLPSAPRAQSAELVVDDNLLPAKVQRAEDHVVWRVAHDGIVITVTGRDITTAPGLRRVRDLESYVRQRDEALASLAAAAKARPAPEPLTGPDDTEPLWAHRGLVAMTLGARDRISAQVALSRPVAWVNVDWRPQWAAATRRQEELRDQDHFTALEEVTAMVHQLGFLQENAAWWDDPDLQRRAINEVVWVTASGEHNVPSAAAQRTWATQRHEAVQAWQSWADRIL
jgi:hypothetical protein